MGSWARRARAPKELQFGEIFGARARGAPRTPFTARTAFKGNCVHFIWHIFWHSFWHAIWRSIRHIFWHSIWPLRSSGAHWARRGSQVEVQRCSLSSEGPRLRSSGAHWARTVAGWGPAVLTELGRSQLEVQWCPLRSDPCSWGPAVHHCVQKLAKSLAKSWQGGSGHGSEGRGGGGEGGGEGEEGGGGEEQLW